MLDGGVGTDHRSSDPRCADVDDQNAGHDQGDGPNGDGRPSFPGLRIPFGSKAALRPRSTSKPLPSASGKKRERLSPMPWWWLMAAPWARVALVTASQAAR